MKNTASALAYGRGINPDISAASLFSSSPYMIAVVFLVLPLCLQFLLFVPSPSQIDGDSKENPN